MVISLSKWPPRRRPNTTGSRTAPKPFVTDAQWAILKDLFPDPPPTSIGGRPRVTPRACLEGIIWVLKNGARWQDLPERYPSSSTCWRRHRDWTESGVWEEAWKRLLDRMDRRKLLHWSEAMGDGTFSPAKKGALMLARPSGARVQRSC